MASAFVLLLFLLTLIVFATEWMAMEIYALLLIATLVVTGILDPVEAFAGFGSSAVIMIAGVMILSGSLLRNGAVEMLAEAPLAWRRASERRMAAALLGGVNLISAFINNVAATALFVPVAEGVAKRFGSDPARYLMPVAFASMTGGVCTVIGTSTNIAVAQALPDYGLEPLAMFELTPLGIVIGLVGAIYLLVAASTQLGSRTPAEMDPSSDLKQFLFEIPVRTESALRGATLRDADLPGRYGVMVLAVLRGPERYETPGPDFEMEEGDLLLVRGSAERLARIQREQGIEGKSMPPSHRRRLIADRAAFVEATVSFTSALLGRTLREWGFRQRYGLSVVAIHRRGELLAERVGKIQLRPADVLLIYGDEDKIDALFRDGQDMLVESVVLTRFDGRRSLGSGVVFLIAVVCSALGLIDPPTAFLAGAALVVATGCLPAGELGAYVNLRFLVMIAGMVSLGTAMEESGAAAMLSGWLASAAGGGRPLGLLAIFFVATVALTQPLNNAAAALLLLPIAIHTATLAGLEPRPFVIIVTVAASCSFITPFEPANLLVYSKGHYRFLDFVRIGAGLTVLVGIVCLLLVPVLWPLH